MNKRSIGWKLLALGTMMTLAVACQPKTPKVPAARFAEVNQALPNSDNTEQDIDDSVYGTNDTSSSFKEEIGQPNFDSEQVLSDIHQVFEETIVPMFTEGEENVVILEAVNPIDIQPQYQEESSEHSEN